MERIMKGEIVEFTLGNGKSMKRVRAKVHSMRNPATIWVTLEDGNTIRRHRIKHNVVRIEGAQKVPDKPLELPEGPKEGKEETSLDDMFNGMI